MFRDVTKLETFIINVSFIDIKHTYLQATNANTLNLF